MRQVPITPYFIVIVLDTVGFQIIAPLLAPMLTSFSHSVLHIDNNALRYFVYGLLISTYPLAYMIGAPILGRLSDTYGRKKLMLVCLGGLLLGFICYLFSFMFKSFIILFIGRLLAGFSAGSQGIAQAAMADISYGRERTINISIIAIAMSLGFVIGPLLSGYLPATMAFDLVIAITIINIILVLIRIPKDTRIKNTNTNSLSFVAEVKRLLNHDKKIMPLLILFFCFELVKSMHCRQK